MKTLRQFFPVPGSLFWNGCPLSDDGFLNLIVFDGSDTPDVPMPVLLFQIPISIVVDSRNLRQAPSDGHLIVWDGMKPEGGTEWMNITSCNKEWMVPQRSPSTRVIF